MQKSHVGRGFGQNGRELSVAEVPTAFFGVKERYHRGGDKVGGNESECIIGKRKGEGSK